MAIKKCVVNDRLLDWKSHWLHDVPITRRPACKWPKRSEEKEGRAGPFVYMIAHWLLWALGRAYTLLSAQMRGVLWQMTARKTAIFAILSRFFHGKL